MSTLATPAPDYATHAGDWARQTFNAAAHRLDAQLHEITASHREGLIDADDVTNLVAPALEVYVRDVTHPLVVAGLAEEATA